MDKVIIISMIKKMLPASAQGETVRREIVAAANRLFYHRGYNQASFSDIAAAAGIPRGNFYYYFKSKDEILGAVIDVRIANIRGMLATWDAAEQDPRLRLKHFTNMLLGAEKDMLRYGCPLGSLIMELGKAQPALKAKAKQMFDLLVDWLAHQFADMGSQQAREIAMQVMARAQGVAVMAQVYGDRALLLAQLTEFEAWIDTLPA